MAYGSNEKSQEVMLEVVKSKEMLGCIVKDCCSHWEQKLSILKVQSFLRGEKTNITISSDLKNT